MVWWKKRSVIQKEIFDAASDAWCKKRMGRKRDVETILSRWDCSVFADYLVKIDGRCETLETELLERRTWNRFCWQSAWNVNVLDVCLCKIDGLIRKGRKQRYERVRYDEGFHRMDGTTLFSLNLFIVFSFAETSGKICALMSCHNIQSIRYSWRQ